MTETTALARVSSWLGIEIRDGESKITVYQPVGLKLLGVLDYLASQGWAVTFDTPRVERVPVWRV